MAQPSVGHRWRRLHRHHQGRQLAQRVRRAVPRRDTSGATWTGVVPAEPTSGVVVASVNCVKATHRPIDQASSGEPRLPGAQPLGLYSGANVYFPYHQLVASVQAHDPDLLVVHGDQYYETSPPNADRPANSSFSTNTFPGCGRSATSPATRRPSSSSTTTTCSDPTCGATAAVPPRAATSPKAATKTQPTS
jgi:hypothetical protein